MRDEEVDLVRAALLTRPAELGVRRWTADAIAFIRSRAEESREVENEEIRLQRTAAVVDGPRDFPSAINVNVASDVCEALSELTWRPPLPSSRIGRKYHGE